MLTLTILLGGMALMILLGAVLAPSRAAAAPATLCGPGEPQAFLTSAIPRDDGPLAAHAPERMEEIIRRLQVQLGRDALEIGHHRSTTERVGESATQPAAIAAASFATSRLRLNLP
jgi:hypothetical protein